MDAVSHALAEVADRIPPQVLDLVFKAPVRSRKHERRDIEFAIRDKIIEGRVRRTVNTVGATMVEIPTSGLRREEIDKFNYIYRVPMTLTGGREISSVVALSYSTNSGAGLGSQLQTNTNSTVMENAGMALANSHMPIPISQTAQLSIIGLNTVHIEDYTPVSSNSWLRCILTSDKDYGHIKPAYYDRFAKLVLLATKAYIFNIYEVELGMGKIVGGVELSEIKNIIDRYSNADEEYEEFVETTWRKVAALNDPKRKQRQNRMLSGGL